AALSVADFTSEDGFAGGFAPAIELKISVANHLDEPGAERFGGASELDIARWIDGFGLGAQLAPLLVHDAFTTDDEDVFLQVIDMLHALTETFEIEGMLWHEHDVRPAIGGTEGNVTGVPAHDFNESNAPMAFGCGADAFDARSCDKNGRSVAGSDV